MNPSLAVSLPDNSPVRVSNTLAGFLFWNEAMDYQTFCRGKHIRPTYSGFDIPLDALGDKAFQWQKRCIQWAVKRGRAALFADTGLGKSAQQLLWADAVVKHTGGHIMGHCPVGVRWQTAGEAAKFGIETPVVVVNTPEDIPSEPAICLVNYEKLHLFDTTDFAGVFLDECFPCDTLIDTPSGQKRIDDIQPGDEIMNLTGVDIVSDTHRREVPYAVKITLHGNASFITSPNHPVFTGRGWRASQDLEPGDSICTTESAMRILRGDDVGPASGGWTIEVLREIMLSEMANASAAAHREGPYSRGEAEARRGKKGLPCIRQRGGIAGKEAHSGIESNEMPIRKGKSLPHIERDEAQTFRAWRKRDGADSTATYFAGCTREYVGSRVERFSGVTDSRLSNALQTRLSESRNQSRYRGGWEYPPQPEGSGLEKGCQAGFTRVESLEILESGHPELERYRDADGSLYFYDLGATRHPSYSVCGHLVHNSSVLKGLNSKTREALTTGWQHSPFRLACTATPAPNDTMELGNHAEFLGICTREEMLSKYFTHDSGDTSKWRLKGHAEADFWDWVCTWAVCISRPSDIGGDDTGYILPELHEITHNVHVPGQVKAGQLFDVSGISATNIHQEKRYTSPFRAEKTAELVRSNDRPWIIWCDTNYEADDIKRLLPDIVEIRGSDTDQQKEDRLRGFTEGRIRTILTKSSMFGQGMNWQHCDQMIFHSINYSFESRYQAIRRCWRFGQTQEVFVHSVTTDTEHAIANTLSVKDARHDNLQTAMSAAMQRSELLASIDAGMTRYNPNRKAQVPAWLMS